jgi:MFS transporter, DHA1 family, tetracycline resistance protein
MRKDRRAGMPFILITVFLDMLGIGLVIPVLPSLVGTLTTGRELQSYWYGALLASYGITQFLGAPLLGALSDRFGRRPVLLARLSLLGAKIGYFSQGSDRRGAQIKERSAKRVSRPDQVSSQQEF